MKQRYRGYIIHAIDDSNYTVSRATTAVKGKKAGQEVVMLVSYHSCLQQAVRRVATLCGNEEPDLVRWLEEYRNVHADFEDMLK